MPRYNLAQMARRQRNIRRASIVLRDIVPPSTMATNLYRACYLPVIAAWTNALPRIEAAYARSLGELTSDAYNSAAGSVGLHGGTGRAPVRATQKSIGTAGPAHITDSPADVRAEIDGAAEAINRLLLILTPDLRDWALRTEAWMRGKWRGAVLSATGVDLQTMLGPADVRATLETTIEWNTALVKDVSAQVKQRISNAVFDGLRNRTPAREVGKAINDAVGLGKARSQRIAADQLTKITSSLAEERRREAGIDTWKWRSSHKLHFRPEHAARDGKEYTDETAPKDLPGRLPYCGCRSQAVISFD